MKHYRILTWYAHFFVSATTRVDLTFIDFLWTVAGWRSSYSPRRLESENCQDTFSSLDWNIHHPCYIGQRVDPREHFHFHCMSIYPFHISSSNVLCQTAQPAVAQKLIPPIRPFLWLCTEQWNNLRFIEQVPHSTHILLLSGLRDELVPPHHMQQLWGAITRKSVERRVWQEFPNGTHSTCLPGSRMQVLKLQAPNFIDDTCVQPGYWHKVKEFVESL